MRHRKAGRKFNMDASARKAMFRNMVTSLMLHGQIRTTAERAKELRRYAERVITLGKRAPNLTQIAKLKGSGKQEATAGRLHAIRRVRRWVNDSDALDKVFGEYAERFQSRAGGYTRVVKAGRRPGDNAAMAFIQLVEELVAVPAEKKTKKPAKKAAKAKPDAPLEEIAGEAAAEVASAGESAPVEAAAEPEVSGEEVLEEDADTDSGHAAKSTEE